MTKDTRSPEQMLSDAIDALRQAYWAHVRELARDIAEHAKGLESTSEDARDELYTYIHETIDGDGWVIYTQKAQAVCMVSENDGAYVENCGSDGLVEDGAINWSRMAYAALEEDVKDRLDTIGVDLNDPSDWPNIELD